MEFLILLSLATAGVWGLAILRHAGGIKIRPLPMLGAAVLLAGCVTGYYFFHVDSGPFPVTIDRVLLLMLLAGFTIEFLREREHLRPLNATDIALLVMIGMLVLSTITHDWSVRKNMPISRLVFFYLMPLSLYFAMRYVRIGITELKWIAISMVALAIYLALTAIAETRELGALVFPRYIMEPGEFFGRGRGPLLNPVINGMLMSIGCCCLWMGWISTSKNLKFWLVAFSGLISLGVFFTYTRSVWLGFLASAAIFIFYRVDRQTKSFLWIAGVLAAVLSFPVIGEKALSFKRDKAVSQTAMEQSAKLRPMFLEVATLMFQDRPFFGCGFGQYAREKYAYLKDAHTEQPLMMTRRYMQHNIFLAYLTETGLIGMGLLVTMLSSMTVQAWRLWQGQQHDMFVRLFGLLMLAILLNYIINGLFHDVSIIPLANTLVFFFAGLVNNLSTAALAMPSLDASSEESLIPRTLHAAQ